MGKQLGLAKGPPSFQKSMSSFLKDMRNKEPKSKKSKSFGGKLQKIDEKIAYSEEKTSKTVKSLNLPFNPSCLYDPLAPVEKGNAYDEDKDAVQEERLASEGYDPNDLRKTFRYLSYRKTSPMSRR
jgi:hypothetical protein